MSLRRDVRRHRRQMLNSKVQLVWTDAAGRDRREVGRCRDVSESGMRVELSHPVEPRTFVAFRMETPHFEGSACVRHCRRGGITWSCGLEFTYGLRFRFAKKAQLLRDQEEVVA